jgi:hypothetical protein
MNKMKTVRFEIYTALLVKIKIFWDVMPCGLTGTNF